MNETASGDYIEGRGFHSAVLARDSKIIIYGGSISNKAKAVTPVLAMLDINIYPFRWTNLNNFTVDAPSPSLTCHSATLYDDFMIITLGRFTVYNIEVLNNKTYIFDTLNYKWVKKLNRRNQLTPLKIFAIVISAVVLFAAIVLMVVFRWKRKVGIQDDRLSNF
ncbi:26106_t:CDS:2 [Dentiscutata erythropus]|uniref:26106_t:CDS:1 n=1 Tax=Dentiscutata erythropus TaxID=1348616 RepID=A0A9N9DTL7_9GLOM|nr:26106_t:CDS:2 [Dentiscutata erythropus]